MNIVHLFREGNGRSTRICVYFVKMQEIIWMKLLGMGDMENV